MKLRIIIAAHSGWEGHQRYGSTLAEVQEHFWWPNIEMDVKSFCESCIHCLVSESGERIPRPLGHAMHAEKPNELIHFDFCFMEKSASEPQYVLVIKDDLSSYCWLYVCMNADANTVVESLLDWFSAFGVCWKWVSDQGTHFKNELMEKLRKHLHSAHHFTQPYCPWSNGTVEVVNRELKRTVKALLSEFKLPSSQ